MHSHEIPADQWVPFFRDVSKRHQGEHVSVEFIGPETGDMAMAKDQSLMGISVDPPSGACKIQVMVGEPRGANISHQISHPVHVRLAQNDDGKDAALEIENDHGPRTLVRFLPVNGS